MKKEVEVEVEVIECPYCEVKVEGKVEGVIHWHEYDVDGPNYLLLACPLCHNALFGIQHYIEAYGIDESGEVFDGWGQVERIWPEPSKNYNNFPKNISRSLKEANDCYKVKAYNACAAMCGHTLEGICYEHGLRERKKTLFDNLDELYNMKIIDERLRQWANTLREFRNFGAHFNKESVTKENAKDALDFTTEICNYIFILNKKFGDFMKRVETLKK